MTVRHAVTYIHTYIHTYIQRGLERAEKILDVMNVMDERYVLG